VTNDGYPTGAQEDYISGYEDASTEAQIKIDSLRSRVEAQEGQIKLAKAALEKTSEHCLCDRSLPGFDYSENHKRLGMPRSGARWLTPRDIIREALSDLEKGELHGN
jgi:hypothetical protein